MATEFKTYFTVCSKCKSKKFTNANAIKARQEKFGGTFEDNVLTTEKEWLCRDCKNKQKEPKEESVKE